MEEKMKKPILVIIVLFMMQFLIASPYSSENSLGIRTAYILPHKMFDVTLTGRYYQTEADREEGLFYGGTFNFGIKNRVQLGLMAMNEDLITANFKVAVTHESMRIPAVAIGLENIFSDIKYTNPGSHTDLPSPFQYVKMTPYFVASKTAVIRGLPLANTLETTLNIGLGSRGYDTRGEYDKYMMGFFGGLQLRPAKGLTLIGEMRGMNFNGGLSYEFGNLKTTVGLIQIEDALKDVASMTADFALTYTFDSLSEVKMKDQRAFQTGKTATGEQLYVSPERSDAADMLKEELRKIQERRERAEKELDEIKNLMKE
jgi:hypothetical protein